MHDHDLYEFFVQKITSHEHGSIRNKSVLINLLSFLRNANESLDGNAKLKYQRSIQIFPRFLSLLPNTNCCKQLVTWVLVVVLWKTTGLFNWERAICEVKKFQVILLANLHWCPSGVHYGTVNGFYIHKLPA